MTRLTIAGSFSYPIWSPDGQYIVFTSLTEGMFWTRADGGGQPQSIAQGKATQIPWSFSPDGKRLAYQVYSASGLRRTQIWTLPIDQRGGQLQVGKPELFPLTQVFPLGPVFSPDGRWLAYEAGEPGSREVYVRAFPPPASGQGGQWQISNSGGQLPVWSRDGHELLYQSGDRIMAVSYTVKGDVFVPDKPRLWVSGLGGLTSFDLAPDGKRLAVLAPVVTAEAPKADHEVGLLLNFFDEVRRRVPVGQR